MSKITMVALTNDNDKVGDITLEISHAERVLKMPKNGGWKLPKNSPYKLDKDGLVKKSSKGDTQKTEKQNNDHKSH